MAASPRPVPQQSPQPKRWHLSPEPWESMSVDDTSPQASQEWPTSSKRQGNPTWFTSLKASWAEAFSQESDIIKEARIHFFSNHPYDWGHDSKNNLSNIYKGLAESTGLLREAIHEIQLFWTGPKELKEANYGLVVPAQRAKFPKGGAHHRVSKGHGTHGHPQSQCP